MWEGFPFEDEGIERTSMQMMKFSVSVSLSAFSHHKTSDAMNWKISFISIRRESQNLSFSLQGSQGGKQKYRDTKIELDEYL